MSEARRPRLVVRINGKETRPLECQIVNNSHFQCDTFSIKLEAWQQPDGFGAEYWAAASDTQIEVLFGTLSADAPANATPDDLSSLIIGNVDDVDLQVEQGTITLTGRDLTSRFIDNKIAQTWLDQTASQIVTNLATGQGLTPQVTATTTPTGKYANGSYAASRHDVPMWDYITFLAEQEGFDAYVIGNTLYFGPPQVDDAAPLLIVFSRDPTKRTINLSTETLKLHRSITLAKDIVVTVISYDAARKLPIKAVAKRQGSQRAASTSFRTGNTAQNYTIRRAGLTQQQAQDLAQNTLDDLSKHERTIAFTKPCDGVLSSRSKATVVGTNTDWDTDYFIDTVTRNYAFGTLTMMATGKNHQVESQPDL